MQEQTWIDPSSQREQWGEGPWGAEPDKVQWTDATGFVCLAKRHPELGHWCGYVGVAPGHPWHGKGEDDICNYKEGDYGPDCHGGLTYAAGCGKGPPETLICHIPEPGTPEHLWWLGFDCGHAGDLSPFMMRRGLSQYRLAMGDVYRDLPYVKEQCRQLAAQAAAAQP